MYMCELWGFRGQESTSHPKHCIWELWGRNKARGWCQTTAWARHNGEEREEGRWRDKDGGVWEAARDKTVEKPWCCCRTQCCIGCLCRTVNDPFHSHIREKSHTHDLTHTQTHTTFCHWCVQTHYCLCSHCVTIISSICCFYSKTLTLSAVKSWRRRSLCSKCHKKYTFIDGILSLILWTILFC